MLLRNCSSMAAAQEDFGEKDEKEDFIKTHGCNFLKKISMGATPLKKSLPIQFL